LAGGAPAAAGGGAGGPLLAAGGAAPQQQAAGGEVLQAPGIAQLQPAGGSGLQLPQGSGASSGSAAQPANRIQVNPSAGGAQGAQPRAAQALFVDSLVTAAQAATVRALPDVVALVLVSQSGIPLAGLNPTPAVHGKLMVAAWAADGGHGARSAAEVRALPSPLSAHVLMLLGVDATWLANLQDFFIDKILLAGAAAQWAVDPSQSQGILNPQRMASLALLASVRVAAAAHNNTEMELTALLSPLEFQALRDGLRAAGRSFKDLVKTRRTWSLPPPTDQGRSISSGSIGSVLSTSSSSVSSIVGSLSTSIGSRNTYSGTAVDASLQAEAERQCYSLKLDTFFASHYI
jgi:hypothetical protein